VYTYTHTHIYTYIYTHIYIYTLGLTRGQHVADVIPGVPIQSLFESFLVEEVADEADGATEHEQTVEHARV